MSRMTAQRTELALKKLTAPISLYKMAGPVEEPEFEKAGPNGRPLERALARGPSGPRWTDTEEETAAALDEPAEPESDPVADAALPAWDGTGEDPSDSAPTMADFEEGGEKALEPPEIRTGLRIADGSTDGTFIDLTDHLAEIDADTKLEEMVVVGFPHRGNLPRALVVGSYYVAPGAADSAKVLKLLRDRLADAGRVGIVKWTKTSRQSLGFLVPSQKGLVVLESEFPQALREMPPQCDLTGVAVTDSERQVAGELIAAMSLSWDALQEQEDDRIRLRKELVARAEAGTLEQFEMPEREARYGGESVEALLTLSMQS